ncbi:UNVERIFIED_ORG: hypothetical protein M2414_004132 [Rahnella aquatilis]
MSPDSSYQTNQSNQIHEQVYEAALDGLLRVRTAIDNSKCASTSPALNRFVSHWLDSVSRRRIYSRHCIVELKRHLKAIRALANCNALHLLQSLVEGKGRLLDVEGSALERYSLLDKFLHLQGWKTNAKDAQAWESIDLTSGKVTFCLLSSLYASFNAGGEYLGGHGIFVAGDLSKYKEALTKHGFDVDVVESEVIDGVEVFSCNLIESFNLENSSTA